MCSVVSRAFMRTAPLAARQIQLRTLSTTQRGFFSVVIEGFSAFRE